MYYCKWYEENRERLLPIRRKYNQEYTKRPEVIEKAKIKNASPEAKLKRRQYKKTDNGRVAERKYQSNPERKLKKKKYRISKAYGISLEKYNELYQEQKGGCAICSKHQEVLDIDHCHKTNKVRGLLCGGCNRGIGMFKENIELLQKAINYLNGTRTD